LIVVVAPVAFFVQTEPTFVKPPSIITFVLKFKIEVSAYMPPATFICLRIDPTALATDNAPNIVCFGASTVPALKSLPVVATYT
jgi:hypothetical protein